MASEAPAVVHPQRLRNCCAATLTRPRRGPCAVLRTASWRQTLPPVRSGRVQQPECLASRATILHGSSGHCCGSTRMTTWLRCRCNPALTRPALMRVGTERVGPCMLHRRSPLFRIVYVGLVHRASSHPGSRPPSSILCTTRCLHSSASSLDSTYLCRMSFHCRCTRVRTDRGLQVRKWLRTPRLMLSQTLFMLLSYALCPPLATPSPWQIGPGRVHLEDESRGEHNPEHCVILAKEGTKRWQGVSRHSRPCDGSRLACRWVELGRPGPTPVS